MLAEKSFEDGDNFKNVFAKVKKCGILLFGVMISVYHIFLCAEV